MATSSRNDDLAALLDAPTLGAAVRLFKLAYLRRALLRAGGNRRDAAAEAGIGYSTFKATLKHAAGFAMRDHVSPKREYRRSLRSTCRVEGCPNASGGPRYGYICEDHRRGLTPRQQEAARDRWRKLHPGSAPRPRSR
jgi:hypothetical protein